MICIETSRLSCLESSKHMTNVLGERRGCALPVGVGYHELDGLVTLPFQQRNFRTLTEPQ